MVRKLKHKKKTTSKKIYSQGRVKRGPAPMVQLKQKSYRKALPELRRDFEDRCAYCMRHIGTKTEMQIDHFDPRKKGDKIQVYSNLFLSDAHCNGAKHNIWPTPEEQAAGCRFLNCCDEYDYGTVIFEDPQTHELEGMSSAAIYHIEMIDLNDPGLVDARRFRAEIMAKLEYARGEAESSPKIMEAVNKLLEMAHGLIPDIPAPPGYWTILNHPVSI